MDERALRSSGGIGAKVRPAPARRAWSAAARPAGSLAHTWLMIALTGWGVFASYFDGWAHNRNKADTFFTIWHADLYGALLVVAIATALTVLYYHRKGYDWPAALPPGYGFIVIGIWAFALGGCADLIWHTIFGIENGAEALVSPTHFLLAGGGTLIILAPFVWAWQRSDAVVPAPRWMDTLLLSIPLAYLLSMLTFMTQFYNPFGRTGTANDYFSRTDLTTELAPFTLEVASVVIQVILLMTVVLLVARHGRLRPGSMTVILGINTALMVFMKANRLATGPMPLFIAAVLAGLAADALLWKLRPSAARPLQFRVFAFAAPFILYVLYFAAIKLAGGGIAVPVHVWTGSILLAGIVGALVSYVVLQPRLLAEVAVDQGEAGQT